MRLFACVTAASVMAGCLMAGGCENFMTKSTYMAERSMGKRWLDKYGSQAAPLPVSADGEKQICKNMPVMGSNMPKRVCSSKAEWDKYDAAARDAVDQADRMRQGMGNVTNGERETPSN